VVLIAITVGKTLAFTSINFLNSKGEVFARGSHTKYVALAWKDPNNIVEELSPKKDDKKP
jgi:acyl-coenzyme A thioesterase 13